MKLGWLTDIHLNFLSEEGIQLFLTNFVSPSIDGWLISGDIGEATNVVPFLERIASATEKPVYFVLGNHDFYRGSILQTVSDVKELTNRKPELVWLTKADVQVLAPGLALVGDDGWGDGRLGRPYETPVRLNDFVLIEELSGLSREKLVMKLNRLGDESAARLTPKLLAAAKNNDQVIVVTHVPPFGGSAWHEGRPSDDDWAPWFSCKAIGDTLLDCAITNPTVDFLVVCGHTHGEGEYSPRSNLKVMTGAAEYGKPRISEVLEFPFS